MDDSFGNLYGISGNHRIKGHRSSRTNLRASSLDDYEFVEKWGEYGYGEGQIITLSKSR